MSASLNYRHVFGVKVNVANALHYAEESTLIYTAGHNVVKYAMDTKVQEFLNGSEASHHISCVSVSSSRRFIAVSEKRPDGAQASVYNLRNLFKKKALSTPEVASQEFVAMCFSPDDSLLLTLGGAPDWTLCSWMWDKGKLLATIRVSPSPDMTVYGVHLNPINATKCVAHGNRVLRLLSIDDDRILNIPMSASFAEREPADYRALTWLPEDRYVVGTRSGELLLFKKEELVTVISGLAAPSAPLAALKSSLGVVGGSGGASLDAGINVLLSCTRGFYCATDSGVVKLFEPVSGSGGSLYSETKSHKLPVTDVVPAVVHMALSPSEEFLAVGTSTNNILQLNLTQADVKGDVSFAPVGVWSHSPMMGTHIGTYTPLKSAVCAITGLDVCVRKPLLVTCGIDCSVRLWNYSLKVQELSKTFPDEPHSVAIHPSGFHVVVGFTDKLRFMNVLMDDLRVIKELSVKACKEVRFSNGGSMFAVASGNLIVVYGTYTCEPVVALRGHNGKVSSMAWLANDAVLISVGVDGAVYEWSIPDGKRFGEFLNKGVGFTGVAPNKDGSQVFATASDASTKLIDMAASAVTLEADLKTNVTALTMSSGGTMLFAGRCASDGLGSVVSYSMPFNGDIVEYPACSGPVSRIRMSYDDTLLFVAGTDGSLLVFEIRDKDGRLPHRDGIVAVPFSEEVLVTRSDLEDRATSIAELRDAVEELQSNNDYANRMRDIAFQERLKKLTERYTTELDHNREQYDLLREEKLDVEHEFSERLKVMEMSHQSEMQKRESLYQNKIMEEVDRFQELQLEVESEKDRQKEIQQKIMDSHDREIGATRDKCAQEWAEVQRRRQETEDEVAGVKRDWEEMRRQMEEDIDTEVELLKKRCEDELATEREATLKYKGDNGIMKKKFAALLKEIEDQREEIKVMLDKEKDLGAHIDTLRKEIEMLRGVISDKDETIADKEKKIYELKKRNQELEKFKFVLDYKIKELKRQIEPRELEITEMRNQIKKVDAELESYHKSNAELDALIGTLRQQLDTLQKSMAEKKIQLASHETLMGRFKHDLHAVIQDLLHGDKLAEGMQQLKESYALEDTTAQKPNEAITREYGRQKQFLQQKVDEAKVQLRQESTDAANVMRKLTEENLSLIEEVKGLRKEVVAAKARRAQVKARPKSQKGTSAALVVAEPGSGSTARIGQVEVLIASQRDEIGSLKAEVRRLEGLLASVRPL